ncbi:enoyl-CoA hydratase domain-containing protein 3, mitochondrial [Sitophilus oryzae]|uniref:Enoyl-CoA hydratase domain-containing protein 3, mitochondrial n=1 Tax=Sitophilus oryzae TaxID=7048 RepID=A0A6J2XM04_SITOR|nr:enoyl-CoA hydratase domain-containing protein 3, mitochondrial [Sitophilus oryzae]
MHINISMFCTKLVSKGLISIMQKSFMSQYTTVNFTHGIKTITMCDQKSRNSLSIAMMKDLLDNINSDKDNYELRLIIISSTGPVFSAGHNLKEIAVDTQKQKECFKLASELMLSIIDSPVPVIAKIDGVAAAAGCQLIAQCDIAVCTERSTFSTPGANFGIFCSTPGVALARSINKMPTLYMLLTGLPIPAVEAKSVGLVTQVCSPDNIDKDLEVICNAIISKSRNVIEMGKKFYYKQIQCDIKEAYDLGESEMINNLQNLDCQEGIRSFIEKRKPQWPIKK